MAGTLTVSGTQTGALEGTRAVGPVTLTMGVVGQQTEVTLASGFNSIAVPATAVGVIIIPVAGNTQTLTLKGVTGDTGIALHVTNPQMIAFAASPPATIGITAGGLTSGPSAFVFF